MGIVIIIDYHFEFWERGKFARITVHISLSQPPLVSQFNLDGNVQKVEYEGLPVICYQCGKYGHNSIACPDKQNSNRAKNGNSESIPLINVVVDKDGAPAVANNSREKFGPWMVVTRKRRTKVVVDKENISDSERNQQNNFSTASRFAALSDDPDTNVAVDVVVQNYSFIPPQ